PSEVKIRPFSLLHNYRVFAQSNCRRVDVLWNRTLRRLSLSKGDWSTIALLCCFGATPLVGELPRSNGQTTAWPAAPSRACMGDGRGNRGARKSVNLNPGGPSRSSSIAPAETILRRASFFGTHAPRDKENQPRNAGEKARPSPRCCFGATPLVGELPRSNGQTTAWPAAPSRACMGDGRGNWGARESVKLNTAGPSRGRS